MLTGNGNQCWLCASKCQSTSCGCTPSNIIYSSPSEIHPSCNTSICQTSMCCVAENISCPVVLSFPSTDDSISLSQTTSSLNVSGYYYRI